MRSSSRVPWAQVAALKLVHVEPDVLARVAPRLRCSVVSPEGLNPSRFNWAASLVMEFWALLHVRNMQRRRRREKLRMYRRQLRDTCNPFELPDIEFKQMFRMSRRLAQDLCEMLSPHLEGQRSNRLPVHTQVLTAVRFFATGSYQRAVSQDLCLAVCQASVSNCVRKISLLIIQNLTAGWIKFPESFEQQELRKNHHNLQILHIDPTMPGSVDDQFIFQYGTLRQALERMYQGGMRNTWLLGDSGYVLEPYLMTPIRNVLVNSPEGRYTTCHHQTRNCVDRLFGVMKSEWQCLLKERVLKYTPPTAGRIIIACAVLNNMMRHYKIEEPHILVNEAPMVCVVNKKVPATNASNVRADIVQRYFQ
uniref:DDE Tnp4 domain-containing protein n=1 Tax=Timema poppense TaxID=170557 RepID=A0A7R9H8T1_TIMPO|nr:unnamed protein product [Timema poppensis]